MTKPSTRDTTMKSRIVYFASVCIALPIGSGIAVGQISWRAVVLDNSMPPAKDSFGRSALADYQGGAMARSDDITWQPVVWHSSPTDYVRLTPPGWVGGQVNAMWGSQQGGIVTGPGDTQHAALWSGTAASFIDLHPNSTYQKSTVFGVGYGQQLGWVESGTARAAMWRGTAQSYVDLHPPTATVSQCAATDGEYQGGAVAFQHMEGHASLWHGTKASWVDINPPGAHLSSVTAMAPGLQVGYAEFDVESHAVIWHGSANSVVDLHPPGAVYSILHGTNGRYSVGTASFGGFGRAGIWLSYSPNSYVNLHGYLDSSFIGSEAYAVSVVDQTIFVVGFAGNSANHAVVWIGTVPTPGTLAPLGVVWLIAQRRRRG